MSDCREIAPLITACADGGAEASVREEVDAHCAACPPCGQRLRDEKTARTALRRCAGSLADQALPPGLESRCRALVEQAQRPRRRPWSSALMPLAVTAALALLAVAVVPALTGRSDRLLAAQLAADHVKCFAVFAPRQATGADARHAEQQLLAHGWQMRVPASSPADGIRLLGVRRCLYGEGTLPHVMYDVGGRHVSLYKLTGRPRAEATLVSFGHQCRIWERDGQTFALVGPDGSDEAFTRAARYVEREAR